MVSKNFTYYFCLFQVDYDKVLKAPMLSSCLNAMNTNLTLNAINASAFEHRSLNSKVIDLNAKIISTDNKVTSATAKSNTYNCVNSKSIYDTKHFQTCACSTITVRSRYVKFLCDENP